MADVIDFGSAKQEREPHLSGPCRCLSCGHQWTGVAPIGKPAGLECPSCHLHRGAYDTFIGADQGRERYVCLHCECDVFSIVPNGGLCAGCGFLHTWDDLAP